MQRIQGLHGANFNGIFFLFSTAPCNNFQTVDAGFSSGQPNGRPTLNDKRSKQRRNPNEHRYSIRK